MPIYQTVYTRWQGRLQRPAGVWWVIARNGLASCVKFWPLSVLVLSWTTAALIGGAMFALGSLLSRQGPLGDVTRVGFDFLRAFGGKEFAGALTSDLSANVAIAWRVLFFALFRFQLWWQSLIGIIFVPLLVARDLHTGGIEFHLSRSVGRADYFFGKLGIAVAAVGSTVLVPAILCYVVGLSFTRVPGIFGRTWTIFPQLLGASLFVVVIYSVVMVGISAVSGNMAATISLWLGFIFGTDIIAHALTQIGGSGWLSMARIVSFRESALILVWNILGLSRALKPWEGAPQIGRLLNSIGQGAMWPPALAFVIAVTALSAALVILRTRTDSR